MVIRIGNAASPRWYDLSLDRLDEYIDRLIDWGATSTELVLHRGEADERIARVHVLEEDWFPVFERYRAHGIVCHAHAPLHPRFKLDRWHDDPDGLRADFLPVIEAIAEFTDRQGEACVLVLHGASGDPIAAMDSTAAFVSWASNALRLTGSDGQLAIELRRPRTPTDRGFDRSRERLAAFVRELGADRTGICWDIGHDWEGRRQNADWSGTVDPEFLALVNHVHLHNAGGDDDAVHFPLQTGRIPWEEHLASLIRSDYRGAITLEVRYRFARLMGEPWSVLGESYGLLRAFLESHEGDHATRDDARAMA